MRLTEEEKNEIAELARQGWKHCAIAEWIGCSTSTVTYHLNGRRYRERKRELLSDYKKRISGSPEKVLAFRQRSREAQRRYYAKKKAIKEAAE